MKFTSKLTDFRLKTYKPVKWIILTRDDPISLLTVTLSECLSDTLHSWLVYGRDGVRHHQSPPAYCLLQLD